MLYNINHKLEPIPLKPAREKFWITPLQNTLPLAPNLSPVLPAPSLFLLPCKAKCELFGELLEEIEKFLRLALTHQRATRVV